jgi:hypothetical protein
MNVRIGLVGLLAFVFASSVAERAARADLTSGGEHSHMFHYIAFSARGFSGVSPGFGTGFLNGGDARLYVQGALWGGFLGTRIGAAGAATFDGQPGSADRPRASQLTLFEGGARRFLYAEHELGTYVGAGLLGGSLEVDRFAFSYAKIFGGFAEVGAEWPRSGTGRLTAAVRFDLASSWRAEYSRISGAPQFLSATLQLGFLVGGGGTQREEPKTP